MKRKHNKKRNTALIFEALILEMTKSIIHSDTAVRKNILGILRHHFCEGAELNKELQCYNALLESPSLDRYTAEKLVFRAKKQYDSLDKERIFAEQTQVINKVNRTVSPKVFSNFIPNYKAFATLAQIFNDRTPLKQRVLMERKVIEEICSSGESSGERLIPVNSLVIKSFTDRYNSKYASLLPEQKKLLNKYILGVGVRDVDFCVVLGEELNRLASQVEASLELKEVKSDPEMCAATQRVLNEIKSIYVPTVGPTELKKILKIQTLVSEYESDAS